MGQPYNPLVGVVPAQGCRAVVPRQPQKRITAAAERTLAAACKMMANFVCRNTMMICGCPNGTALQPAGWVSSPRWVVGLPYHGSRKNTTAAAKIYPRK